MSSSLSSSPDFHALRRFSLMSSTQPDGEVLESDRIPWLEQLAERFKQLRWHTMFDRFHDLSRAVPLEILRSLLDPAQSEAVRTMAIDLAGAAERHDFADDIAAVATHSKETARLRALAAATLARLDPEKQFPRRSDG